MQSSFSFKPTAADADGDDLLFGVDGLPPWLEFDSLTGELSGTPGPEDVGTYQGIVVWVTDGEHDTLLPPFDLVVESETPSDNIAPEISGSPATDVIAGETYSFVPQAEDADADLLSFTIRNRPVWSTFNAETGRLQGAPTAASAGVYDDIVIAVNDGESTTALPPFSIRVTISGVNTAPIISGEPMTSVAVSTAYSFTATASDIDGDTLTFSIENAPVWASFDPAIGELAGTPGADDASTYADIAISVTDGIETAALPAFSLTVTPPTENNPPTISGSPSLTVLQGAAYDFLPAADDADGDALSFSISNRPAWADFDEVTGRLSGTPGAGNVGRYSNIVISVSDGAASAALFRFTLTVEAQNSAPTLSGTPTATVQQGTAYSFQPTASDPDGDALTFSITNAPSWASFDTSNGRLTGTPAAADVGEHGDIAISATDGSTTAELAAFSITVTALPVNAPPTISGTPPASVTQGVAYTFTPTAADADGDTLTFSIVNRPTWASFNGNTGRLQGTPTSPATHGDIRITVSDGDATTQLAAFTIVVTAPAATNQAPTISGTASTSASVGTEYTFQPAAADADGDSLSFAIVNGPAWATFNSTTGRLQGTPGAGDAGTFSDIRISVGDGEATAQLAAFAITVAPAANAAPTISGSPSTSVVQDAQYSFRPTAADSDGDVLTFEIANAPSWASFDPSNGTLSGEPAAGDVATYANIRISVTDGEDTASLAAFSIVVQAVANGSATLSWTAPTEKTDGSPLDNLAGFKVYWGAEAGSYSEEIELDGVGNTTYVIENLGSGTWYFAITAIDSNGLESDYSNVASKTIP